MIRKFLYRYNIIYKQLQKSSKWKFNYKKNKLKQTGKKLYKTINKKGRKKLMFISNKITLFYTKNSDNNIKKIDNKNYFEYN